MPHSKRLLIAVALTVSLSATASPARAEVLKKESPMGQLREGQTVLVDGGSCPPGQIKEVIGGNHVNVGGTKHILRTRKCIPN